MKKKGNIVMMKHSRSASDIRHEILDQKDTFCCFQNRLGSRSLSHDSVFLSETRQLDLKPSHVLSQETVHGKIQALQIKLQRQKMRLGPPPLVLPIKQAEDNLQPFEVLTSKNMPHKSSSQGDFPYSISPKLPPVYTSAPSPVVDFSTLPKLIPCLDNSAARHRMSIKPRNQRASTKSKKMPHTDKSRPHSESMIILERPLAAHKAEDEKVITKEITGIHSGQTIKKGHNAPPIKSPGPSLPQEFLVEADEDINLCAVGKYKEEEAPAVSSIVPTDGGTKQMLKIEEGIVTDHSYSSGHYSHKESEEHKESLCRSKPKDVDGDAVSVHSVYISSGFEQFQHMGDKLLNTVTTQMKDKALNRNDSRFQATMQEYSLQDQLIKPLTLLYNKSESRNVNPRFSQLLAKQEGCLQEFPNQPQFLSFSVSSDKRQRTRSFTDKIEQGEVKQEPVFLHIKPLTNLNREDLTQKVFATGKVPSQTGDISTPEVLTKLRDLPTNVSADQDRTDRPNKTRDMTLGTQIDETNKNMNKIIQEQKKEQIASELKLHSAYQLEVIEKQQNTEVRNTLQSPECATNLYVGQNDRPLRETVFGCSPIYNTELFKPSESSVFSSKPPKGARRDKERHGYIKYSDLEASTQFAHSTINMTRSTPVHVNETDPLKTNAKKSDEGYLELSWMTMAREKTRNLQQLSTSTLNDLTGLQTVTRPAASTSMHIQPSSSVILAQPMIDQSESILPTCHIQTIDLNARSGKIPPHTILDPVKTEIYTPSTQIIHATQQQLSQMPLHQAYPIQQSLSQSVKKTQSSQSLRQTQSPKLTPRQPSHQSLSVVLQHRPLVETISSLPSEKVDWIAIPQERSPTGGRTQYTGSLGSKNLLIEQWHHQKPDTVRVDQKPKAGTQTYKHLDEFPTLSSHRKFTELAVSPRPMRLDREVKWQKKTFSPPSPPSSLHLESSSEGRQPSWMELAKRKSMAWSDKSMD